MKHAKVQSVELSETTPSTCPFFVTGLITLSNGRIESFAWRVPALDNWDGFDFSEARINNQALRIAL